MVRSSHERLDGSGYPDGLEGELIPLGSRVIGTCAEFIALTSGGSKPRTTKQALAALRRRAGKQFDPLELDALAAVSSRVPADLVVAG